MATGKTLDGKPYAGNPLYKFAAMSLSLSGLFLLVCSADAVTFPYYQWQKVGSEWSGSYTNTARWSGSPALAEGAYPGCYDDERTHAGEYAALDFRNAAHDGLDVTISYPQGVVTNFGQFFARTSRKMRLRFDGRGTTLVFPQPTGGSLPADENRGTYYYAVEIGDPCSQIIKPDTNGQALPAEGLYEFNDFSYSLTNDVDESRFEWERGEFIFRKVGYWHFFNPGLRNHLARVFQVDRDADVKFDAATVFYAPSTNQLMRVKGGKLHLGGMVWSLGPYWGTATNNDYDRLVEISVLEGGMFTYGPASGGNGLAFFMGLDSTSVDSSTTTIRILADNGTVNQPAVNYETTAVGPGTHELILRNGSAGAFAGKVSFGNVAGAVGSISITDSTAAFDRNVFLGGASAAAVTGGGVGSLSVSNSTVTLASVDGNKCTVYNGSVSLADATVELGSAQACIIGSSTYGGTRTFAADGATIRARSNASVSPVSGFDTATIGAGGLTVDAPTAITLSQSFSGAGTLTLSGSGAKTVSGDIACAKAVVSGGGATFTGGVTAEVVATNGATVAFSGNSTQLAPLGGLRLGDRSARTVGRLVMQPNETVWVGGPVDLQCLRIAISGAASAGDTFAVACMQGAGETVREEWAKLQIVSGLPANTSWEVSEEEIVGGGKKLVATLCSMAPVTVALASGADTHATNITYGSGAELDVVPETNAKLYFEGDMGYGALVKAGGGAAYLSGANSFVAGFVANGGLLSFATGASVGDTWESKPSVLRDGTLEFLGETTLVNPIEINASSGDNGLVVFKNEADVTMPIPTVTQGAIVKRGKGRLTFEVKADVDWSGLKKGSTNASSGEQMVFDDANGTSPAMTSYGVVNVAEGELVMRGVGASKPTISFASNTLANHTVVGISSSPAPANPAQPGLVLDNVAYESVAGFLGGGSDMYVSRQLTGATASFLVAPYLYITNGASLKVNGIALGYGSNDDQVHVDLLLDNGEIQACYEAYLSQNASNKSSHHTTNNIVLRNGSRLFASYGKGRLKLTGTSSRFDVDGSTIARNASGEPLGMFFSDRSGSGVDMTFRNGSYFGCYMIGMDYDGASQSGRYPNYPIHLTFDDSEWYLGAGNLTLPSSNMNVRVTVVGGGLKLNPPDGSTWRLYTRVDGDAGIVKGGAGTLLVDRQFKYHEYVEADPVTLAYAGRTEVLDGTLSVVPGAMAAENAAFFVANGATLDLQDAEVSGLDLAVTNSATLSRAALSGATFRIAYDDASGTFARLELSNVTTSGRTVIDFGRSTENPLPSEFERLPVGSWTGTKPDVSSWRGVNGGITGRGYAFAATDGGDIVATSVGRGAIIVLR